MDLIYYNKKNRRCKNLTYKSLSTVVKTNKIIKHNKENMTKKWIGIVLIEGCIDQIQDKSMIVHS